MNPALQRLDDLSHARWRVKFLKNLLEVHRSIPHRSGNDWLLQEADYLKRIVQAESELELKSGMGVTTPSLQAGKLAIAHLP